MLEWIMTRKGVGCHAKARNNPPRAPLDPGYFLFETIKSDPCISDWVPVCRSCEPETCVDFVRPTALPKVESCNIPLKLASSNSHEAGIVVSVTICTTDRVVLLGAVYSTLTA